MPADSWFPEIVNAPSWPVEVDWIAIAELALIPLDLASNVLLRIVYGPAPESDCMQSE